MYTCSAYIRMETLTLILMGMPKLISTETYVLYTTHYKFGNEHVCARVWVWGI